MVTANGAGEARGGQAQAEASAGGLPGGGGGQTRSALSTERIFTPRSDPACNDRMTLGGTTSSIVCPATDSPLPRRSGRAYFECMAVRHLVTAEELERMGSPDFGFELVRGELVPVTPAGREHGALTAFFITELSSFVRPRTLGRVYNELGFKLFTNPDTVRALDVSCVSREREAVFQGRRGFVTGVPDLAVEIVSFDKTVAEVWTELGTVAATPAPRRGPQPTRSPGPRRPPEACLYHPRLTATCHVWS